MSAGAGVVGNPIVLSIGINNNNYHGGLYALISTTFNNNNNVKPSTAKLQTHHIYLYLYSTCTRVIHIRLIDDGPQTNS